MRRTQIFKPIWLLFLLCFIPLHTFSQALSVKGVVTSVTGEVLPGVNIIEVGTSNGTITDINGNFVINASPKAVLKITYIGYQTQMVNVSNAKNLRIQLKDDTKVLNDVVVTALGIKREKKALGYAVDNVGGESLVKAKSTNVINSLAGSVAGLIVNQTASGPSGSTSVLLRGNTSLAGNNQPLYVIDGQPMDNTNFNSAGQFGGYDLGDGISSISADDIENISILKGPAAAALYGSRASNGVIMITTKRADQKESFGVEFNSTTTIDKQLSKFGDMQNIYGQGTGGQINGGADATKDKGTVNTSWGPRYDSKLYITSFDGVRRPYTLINNNIADFFQTGITSNNTLAINTSKGTTGIRFSYNDMRNRDITPNSNMSRNSFTIRTNTKLLKKIDIDTKVNYIHENVLNRPALSDSRGTLGKNLMSLAGNIDQQWLKNNNVDAQGNYVDWNNNDVWHLNPYWVAYEKKNTSKKDRLIASASANYTVTDGLNFKVSGGTDINYFRFDDFTPATDPEWPTGHWKTDDYQNKTYNVEALLNYNKTWNSIYSLNANLGGSIFSVNNLTTSIEGTDMKARDVKDINGFNTKTVVDYPYKKEIQSLYATANFGYRSLAYLDASLRVDRSSTLPKNNNTYFYPSVSGSLILSELFKMDKNIFPFVKLRASYAQVGSDTDPYKLDMYYMLANKAIDGFPMGGTSQSIVPNKNLKPTRTNSWEMGGEFKFIENRLGLDVTYYTQSSIDQIMNINTSLTSGYNGVVINAGNIQNKGFEISLNAVPVQLKDFRWDVRVNFARNISKVNKLTDDVTNYDLTQARWLSVAVSATTGQSYGIIRGYDFKRNDNGDILIDKNTGLPQHTSALAKIGNSQWDWSGGLTSSFKYKNVSLSVLFDIKWGADLFSMTAGSTYVSGKNIATVEGRDAWYASEEQRIRAGVSQSAWTPTGGYLAKGVIDNGDGTFSPNARYVDPQAYWNEVGANVSSAFIYDNSYIKIREINLTYSLPQTWLHGFIKEAAFSLVARNPFILYSKVPNIDPESGYNTSGSGLEYGSLPSRRNIGLNVSVKF